MKNRKAKAKSKSGRKSVSSSCERANPYVVCVDVKTIGKGKSGLKDLFAPRTSSHTSIGASVNLKEKDFVVFQ